MIRLTRAKVWDIYASLEDREEISDYFYEMWRNMDDDEKVEVSLKKVLDS